MISGARYQRVATYSVNGEPAEAAAEEEESGWKPRARPKSQILSCTENKSMKVRLRDALKGSTRRKEGEGGNEGGWTYLTVRIHKHIPRLDIPMEHVR